MKFKKQGRFIAVFILSILGTCSSAQTQNTDSLRRLVESTHNDSLKILIRNKLILALSPTDTLETNQLMNLNKESYEKSRNPYIEGQCFLTAGIYYSKMAEYELAMNNLTGAQSLFSKLNSKEWS